MDNNSEEIWTSEYSKLNRAELKPALAKLEENKGLLQANLDNEAPHLLTLACGLTNSFPFDMNDANKTCHYKRFTGCLIFAKMMNNDFGEHLDYFMPSTEVDEKRKLIGRIILTTLAF